MAITKDTFRMLIREGQELIQSIDLYDRSFDFEDEGRYVMVGVRQAGKSYMLFMRAKQLIAAGHSADEFVYVNFDDERLLNMDADDFDLILQAYESVHQSRPILLFDEIQNIPGWEHFARRLANQKYHVFITGSNANMLSREIQTTLGGRYISKKIYPYSFKEYLEAQGMALPPQWQYGKEKALVQQQMAEYLRWGGFPELIHYKNKRNWLNDLYEKILLGDVVLRNKVKNDLALRMAVKRLADNVKQPTSFRRLTNLITGMGLKTSVSSVADYVRFTKESFVLFSLENYASKFVEKETVQKHYFVDNGLLSIFQSNDLPSLLENLCAIHLRRRFEAELYFWNKNVEVDFFVPEEAYAVQAAYSIADEAARDRELEGLRRLHKHMPLQRMEIVTYDEEATLHLPSGEPVQVVPVWKWLLAEE